MMRDFENKYKRYNELGEKIKQYQNEQDALMEERKNIENKMSNIDQIIESLKEEYDTLGDDMFGYF